MTQTWVSSYHRAGSTSQTASAPTFSVPAGTYTSARAVALACITPGAQVFYTVDGSPATPASTLYVGLITVSSNTIINAVATAPGVLQGPQATAAYVISTATPSISPAAGTYSSPQSVALSCATPGSTIFYTIDGTQPTTASSVYSSPFTLSATATVKAIGTAPGFGTSSTATSAYTISNATAVGMPRPYGRQLDSPQTNVGLASWQQQMAKYDYVAFVAFGGAEGGIGGGQTFASVFASMKNYALTSLNGHVVKTGHERMNQEWLQSTSSGVDIVKTNVLNNNLGWALQASNYPSGAKVAQESIYWVANACRIPWCPAYTSNTVGAIPGPSSPSGANLGPVTWSQWTAWYEYQADVAGNLHAMGDPNSQVANPNVDFIDHDNQFMGPRSNGCWQSNSTVYTYIFGGAGNTANTVAPHLQQGYADAAAVRRALQPGCLIVGNVDYFLFFGNSTNPQVIDPSNLGLWDIALCEAPIGLSNSYATFNTFNQLLNALVSVEQVCTPTGKPCFLMEGSGNGAYQDFNSAQSGWTTSQWRAARYQIGLAALLRHIPGIQPQGNNFAYWFDEWDAGNGTLHWWGQPLGARSFTPNSKGIIVIPYSGGTFYLYPAATNDVTTGLSPIVLGASDLVNGGGHHISYGGFGDPAINTGAAFTSLTIQPRDCIFTLP